MIKVKKTDSIVDIILKMKYEKEDKIVLEFPFWHPVLHNYTSLKILKTKAEDKEIIISTNDLTAKKIGKKIGIKYSLSSNPDLIWHNYSFWEYFLYAIKSYFKDLGDTILEKWKYNSFSKYQKLYWNWKISYFISFLIISIVLLFFVFYFAVNKTYVYIKPEIEVRERATNFVFKEYSDEESVIDEDIIKLKKIQNTVNIRDTFWTTWVKPEDISNSKWKVTIYNLYKEEIELIKNTRLQTNNSVVFLIQKNIVIPKAEIKNWILVEWKLNLEVVARTKDADWKISWKNWNIAKWTKLFLPGLKGEDRKNIYAISSENFKWWKDSYKKILTKQDIENAKKLLKKKLEKKWLSKLKNDLKKENDVNDINYEILETKNIIKYYDFEVTWLENLEIWKQIDKFELFWTLKTETYIYNKELLLGKLKSIIKDNVLNNVEEILGIDEKSLSVVLELSRKEKPFQIKATVQIDVFFIQNFLNKKNSYTLKLKNLIIGKDKDEAEKILINNKKISNANIKIRPFFINKVSKLSENIEFKIVNE